jgi:GT2 family glycosyltransferase
MYEHPPANRPSATVVICAYTTRRFSVLKRAISAVVGQLTPNDDLLVVIDHNPELLGLVAANVAGDNSPTTRILVLANENGQGLSGARNTGVGRANGEIIAFLDDDAVPQADWLAELTAPFTDPAIIGVGGVARPAWEVEPPDWFPPEFLWVVGCSYKGLADHLADIRNPIGANMAFRRAVIEKAGGFTDGIGRVGRTPLGCEETELSIRATRVASGRIVQQGTASVDHLVTADRVSFGYFLRRCWAEGISKAIVSRLAGSNSALSSERRYTTRTLPAGFALGLRDGVTGKPAGFKRAGAIAIGLAVTIAGYLRGTASRAQPAHASVDMSG